MFYQKKFDEILLEALYTALCSMKNKQLTMLEFHYNIASLTHESLGEFIGKDTPNSILAWYYSKFRIIEIKNMAFTIDHNMWTYEEYQQLGVAAVRGMGECSCCGKLTNVNDYSTKNGFVCSVDCLNKLRGIGR